MKNSKRNIWTLILLLSSALCLIFAACGGGGVKLTFETNCDVTVEAMTAEEGQEVELPVPAEREGYSFEGWYENADFSGEPVQKVVAEKDKTFYAKWAKLFAVNLDVGAGSLPSAKFYLKAGENISGKAGEYVPVRDGWQFGEWLLGNEALSPSAVMPEEDITLTARYKVGYIVHTFRQNLAQNEYEPGEDIKGYDYPAANYTPAIEVRGFHVTAHDGEVTTKNLSETPSENEYTFYLDREKYTVTLLSNYPEGAEERQTIDYIFGQKVELPFDAFYMDGYLLSGWSTGTTGAPEYPSNAVRGLVLNGDGEEYKDEFIFASDGNEITDITLYAIWQEGYRDLFGGEDVVFHPSEEADYVILQRCGNYYLGSYRANDRSFEFENSVELSGKLFENGFVYLDESRDGRTYYRYMTGGGILNNETVSLDAYNGISYSVTRETGPDVSNGTYYVDEDGYYIAEFTSGSLGGSTVKMLVGYVQVSTTSAIRVFLTCNESEVARGPMIMYGITDDGKVGYVQYTLTLDGFGNATLSAGSSVSRYIYVSDGDKFALYTSGNSLFGVFKFMNHEMGEGFILYDSALDHTFTSADGATLELDGACNAVYTSAGTSMVCIYTAEDSVFGGSIVTLYAGDGNRYIYRVYTTGAEENAEYILEEKNTGYAEYCYSSEAGQDPLYSPLLVIDDEANRKASVYSRTTDSQRVYLKVAEGTFEYNEETDNYNFTVTEKFSPEQDVFVKPIDVLRLKSFVYSVGVADGKDVTYWYSVTYEGADGGNDETIGFDAKYTDETGNTLTLVGGFAIYTAADGGETLSGVYYFLADYENIIRATFGGYYRFYELSGQEEETKTFISLDVFIGLGKVREVTADGMIDSSVVFVFDGKGGATLTVTPEAAEGEEAPPEPTVVKGTYEEAEEKTAFEAPVYHFKPEGEGEEFDFIILSTSNGVFFARFNKEVPLELHSEKGETLKLDGYSYIAEYNSPENEQPVQGNYFIPEENVIEFIIGNSTFYFDFDPTNQTFTLRGSEAATYFFFDNQYMDGLAFEFDGYGNATLVKYDLENGGEKQELGKGTYSDDGGVWTVDITGEGDSHDYYVGYLAFYTVSSSQALRIFIKEYTDVVRSYIDVDDWSVLTPDSLGNATLYSATGKTESGTYTIITDSLMYYVNNSATDACLYRYDNSNGTVQRIVYKDRGYYASDLRALQFSRYGFMIMDGETRYYYTLNEDGSVTTYEQKPDMDGANKYGFVVHENFCKFEEQITVDEVLYYKNDGFPIQFKREEETKNEYPVLYSKDTDDSGNEVETKKALGSLTFQPTGAMEFRVTGSVAFEDAEPLSCTVVREAVKGEDGEPTEDYDFYVLIGNYRFDIEMTYAGESSSTYKVTGMRYIISAYNSIFYSYYVLFAMIYGESYALSMRPAFGSFTVTQEFDTEGEITEKYINAALGLSSVTLLNGDTVTSLEHEAYETMENGLFVVTRTEADEQTYKYYFALSIDKNYGYIYSLYACTRVQTLQSGETEGVSYEAEVERTVAAEVWTQSIYSVTLKENGTELEYECYLNGNTAYCIVRTRDKLSTDGENEATGPIQTSVYYILTFTEKAAEDAGDGTESGGGEEGEGGEENTGKPIPLFEAFTVEKHETKTVYDASGFNFVDIEEVEGTSKVIAFYYQGGMYIATESVYDEGTATYTVTLASGAQVTIKITKDSEGKETAEITPVKTA